MTCAALTLALALGTACEYEVLSRSLEAERRTAWALVAPDQPYPGQAVRGQGAPAPAPAADRRRGPRPSSTRARTGVPAPAADRRIVDGDTVVIDGVRVRLAGIDAPERGQQHGRHDDAGALATTALAKTMTRYETRGWALSVETDGHTDKYGRRIGVLVAKRGGKRRDLNQALVESGVARAAYGEQYAGAERRARATRRGLWADGEFNPADHR